MIKKSAPEFIKKNMPKDKHEILNFAFNKNKNITGSKIYEAAHVSRVIKLRKIIPPPSPHRFLTRDASRSTQPRRNPNNVPL